MLVGLLNILVAYNFPEPVWVNFKVFGLTAITLVFMFAQVFWIVSKAESQADTGE